MIYAIKTATRCTSFCFFVEPHRLGGGVVHAASAPSGFLSSVTNFPRLFLLLRHLGNKEANKVASNVRFRFSGQIKQHGKIGSELSRILADLPA